MQFGFHKDQILSLIKGLEHQVRGIHVLVPPSLSDKWSSKGWRGQGPDWWRDLRTLDGFSLLTHGLGQQRLAQSVKIATYHGAPIGLLIKLTNDWEISIRWGTGNYSSNRYSDSPPEVEVENAEVAVILPNGEFGRTDWGDQVVAHVTYPQVVKAINWISLRSPDLSLIPEEDSDAFWQALWDCWEDENEQNKTKGPHSPRKEASMDADSKNEDLTIPLDDLTSTKLLGDRIHDTIDTLNRTREAMHRALEGDLTKGPDIDETVRLSRDLAEANDRLLQQLQVVNSWSHRMTDGEADRAALERKVKDLEQEIRDKEDLDREAIEEALEEKCSDLQVLDTWDKVEEVDTILSNKGIDDSELEDRLDTEDLREVLQEIRDKCEGAVNAAQAAKDLANENL